MINIEQLEPPQRACFDSNEAPWRAAPFPAENGLSSRQPELGPFLFHLAWSHARCAKSAGTSCTVTAWRRRPAQSDSNRKPRLVAVFELAGSPGRGAGR